MTPDDESVRRAMQHISPAGSDAPDLFERVAAGARRRRRRRSVGGVAAAAVVVAVVALVPALDRGNTSTKTQPAGPGAVATSSPVKANFPGVGPSTVVSPSRSVSPSEVASAPEAVTSPSPPLSSTPPTPPLITTGACAGLTVSLVYGDQRANSLLIIALASEPSLNLLTVEAGDTVGFSAFGPTGCVDRVAVTPNSTTFPSVGTSPQSGQTFAAPQLRPAAPGVEDVDVLLRACAAPATCDGGQLLASTVISVDPPASSSANPVAGNLGACPTVLPLVPGADAAAQAKAAAEKVVPTIYPPEPTKDFTVTAVYPASSSLGGGKGIGMIAYSTCGRTIGDRTWVVEVHFPHDLMNSASTGNGQLFVSEFASGWKVWFRNH
jgi:hypothetical protein